MTFRQLENRLRRLNSKFRLIAGPNMLSGVYLHLPRHPDSNPLTGNYHLCGMPSPRRFWSLPKRSFTIDGIAIRGIGSFIDNMVRTKVDGMQILSKCRALNAFPQYRDWDTKRTAREKLKKYDHLGVAL